MQVLGSHHLGRGLAYPSAILKDAVIDTDKIDEVYLHRLTANHLDSVVEIKAGSILICIGLVIDITPCQRLQQPVLMVIVPRVGSVAGQQGLKSESQLVVGDPLGEIGLLVIPVLVHIAGAALVVGPGDILLYGDVLADVTGLAVILLRNGARIGDAVAINHLAHTIHVGTTLQLVPRIVRKSVSIHVLRHHDDAWLTTVLETTVALYQHILLSFHIGNGVVEMEGDIATISTQTNHVFLIIGQAVSTLLDHSL